MELARTARRYAGVLLLHWAAGTACWWVVASTALRNTNEPRIWAYVPLVVAVLGALPVPLTAAALLREPVWPVLARIHALLLAAGLAVALVDPSPLSAVLGGLYGHALGAAWADWHTMRARRAGEAAG
jgi:hypothetical protein